MIFTKGPGNRPWWICSFESTQAGDRRTVEKRFLRIRKHNETSTYLGDRHEGRKSPERRQLPVAAFVKDEFQGEWSNWWVPTLVCLRHWIESSGFEIVESSLIARETRGFCIARKSSELSPEHMILPSFQ